MIENMIETTLHLLIILIYFLLIIPASIVFVTTHENAILLFFKQPWTIGVVMLMGAISFLLTKYVSPSFVFLFLHVLGFFGAWYYWHFRRQNKHLLKDSE